MHNTFLLLHRVSNANSGGPSRSCSVPEGMRKPVLCPSSSISDPSPWALPGAPGGLATGPDPFLSGCGFTHEVGDPEGGPGAHLVDPYLSHKTLVDWGYPCWHLFWGAQTQAELTLRVTAWSPVQHGLCHPASCPLKTHNRHFTPCSALKSVSLHCRRVDF